MKLEKNLTYNLSLQPKSTHFFCRLTRLQDGDTKVKFMLNI